MIPLTRAVASSKNVFNPFGTRFFTPGTRSAEKSNPLLLILGNSNVGGTVAIQGLARGFDIKVTTRFPPKNSKDGVEYIQTPETRLREKEFWRDVTASHIQDYRSVLVVNTIGGSVPSKDTCLLDLNATIPEAAVTGIHEGMKPGTRHHFVHLSTIAAAGLEAPYGKTKRAGEERLVKLTGPNLTIFRMGYVIDPLIRHLVTHSYKEQHRLSLEQMCILPYQFLIGDREQYNRVPVPIISARDVAKGIFNTFSQPRSEKIIDAVNDENITQEQLCKFFTDLLGKKFRPIHIPVDAAKTLAKHHSFGHLDPYCIEFCEMKHQIKPSSKIFSEIVGGPFNTLKSMYTLYKSELVIPRPPFDDLIAHVFKNLWNKPESRVDTVRAVLSIAKVICTPSKYEPRFLPLAHCAPKKGYKWSTTSEKKFSEHTQHNQKRSETDEITLLRLLKRFPKYRLNHNFSPDEETEV